MNPISGIVIHGKALGRTIGFPTANLSLPCDCTDLADGTYGLSWIVEGREYYGIWVYRREIELFEAHFFDFDADIYDEMISVTPLFLIRENRKFSWLEELKSQIQNDREVMENWLERNT